MASHLHVTFSNYLKYSNLISICSIPGENATAKKNLQFPDTSISISVAIR